LFLFGAQRPIEKAIGERIHVTQKEPESGMIAYGIVIPTR